MAAALLVVASMLAMWPGGTCPSDYFCAPTVGIYEQIAPYSDVSARTDIGPMARSLTYIDQVYVVGHAYTQFWAIVMLKSGDVVYVNGLGYRITGRYIQFACGSPPAVLSDLSLQTSLSSETCGLDIVVQGIKEFP